MGINKWFILFAICLAVGFAAAPAMAKEQGAAIQVDSDTNCNTTDPSSADRQDNTIEGDTFIVWFNLTTASDSGDYTWTLSDKGKVICSGTFEADLIVCGAPEDQWYHVSVDLSEDSDGTGTNCAPTGSVTFAVFQDGKSVGSDSFRIVPAP